MTREEFAEKAKDVLFLDGATGSFMLAAGMPRGVCTEQWIYEHKDVLLRLQKAYVAAGSQIIYAPTFGANRYNLKDHHAGEKIRELNAGLVQYSKEAADGKALVAGDVTTTGRIIGFSDDYEYKDAYDNYCEQIGMLAEAGADLIVIETMISDEEITAAVDAAMNVCDLPILVSASVASDGRMIYGGNILELAPELEAMGVSAVGVNCSLGPSQMGSIVQNILKNVSIPVIAKPNAGLPEIREDGRAIYHITPEEFADAVVEMKESGASLLGCCCGTGPKFIRAMVKRICPERIREEKENDQY